jgi:hypothetical protein
MLDKKRSLKQILFSVLSSSFLCENELYICKLSINRVVPKNTAIKACGDLT